MSSFKGVSEDFLPKKCPFFSLCPYRTLPCLSQNISWNHFLISKIFFEIYIKNIITYLRIYRAFLVTNKTDLLMFQNIINKVNKSWKTIKTRTGAEVYLPISLNKSNHQEIKSIYKIKFQIIARNSSANKIKTWRSLAFKGARIVLVIL